MLELDGKKGNFLRNLPVLAQRNGLQKWKDSVSYGQQWMLETVFSYIKRTFGEYVYSVRLKKYDTGNDVKNILVQ
jgi:hypothetical protein